MRPWMLWCLVLAVLAAVFAAYIRPESQVVLANLWAMCGF